MRILLTGGGTGGHVIPHGAIIYELERVNNCASSQSREHDTECPTTSQIPAGNCPPEFLYLGSNSGIEEEFCNTHGIQFHPIATGKLRRYFSIQNLLDWFKIPVGVIQSLVTIARFKPDIIFSKGGYVAVPVVLAGGILRKKIVIHESDFTPGLATRISSYFSDTICVPHENTREHFSLRFRAKVVVTGNPVRKELLNGSKESALKFLTGSSDSLSPPPSVSSSPVTDHPVILVMGGSTGAQKLNELIWKSLEPLLQKFTIIHITGKGKGLRSSGSNPATNSLQKCFGKELWKRYFEFEYMSEELRDMYALADFVICRSGAGTVSEINALGLPAVYVPLSSGASRGDQWENAKYMSTTPHIILDDSKIPPNEFVQTITEFYAQNKKVKKQGLEATNAAQKIAREIIDAYIPPHVS